MTKHKIYTISVVICTLNRPDDLVKTVHSVLDQSLLPKEIIVVDAGELGDVSIELEKLTGQAGIQYHYQKEQPSTTKQRNIGADMATGEILFFLDDHIQLSKNYFSEIHEIYLEKKNENIGGVTGVNTIFTSQSILRYIYNKIFCLRQTNTKGGSKLKRSNFPVWVNNPEKIEMCEVMPSTAVSYLRDVFNKFRFDDRLDGYVMAEDVDLSYRISRNYKLYITPHAKYVHDQFPLSKNEIAERERRRIYFTQYFFKKNLSQNAINWVFRYWAMFGLFLFYFYIAIKNRQRDSIKGFLLGIKKAMKDDLMFPI